MRKKGLDILRGLAIILVLFRHSDLDHNIVAKFGWLGVDLFFTLSGFLISNMLFEEYKLSGRINIGKFLFRRGAKIFSPFYFFLISTTFLAHFNHGISYDWNKLLHEFFYLQSYANGIWPHTWSLAVEEHFYLWISILILLLTKSNLLEQKKLIISSFVLLLIASFSMRYYISYTHRTEDFFSFFQSHLRADGLILGALLSYLMHFTDLLIPILKHKKLIVIISGLLVSPGFYYDGGSFVMNTIGLTSVNLGFSLMVLVSLNIDKHINNKYFYRPTALLCFIGINSYSIYLWHIYVKEYFFARQYPDPLYNVVLYITVSIICGTLLAYIIEKPSLKIRDYLTEKYSE